MQRFTKSSNTFWLILILTFGFIYIARTYLNHIFGGMLELMIAVGGLFLIIIQLRNNHKITKAEFIYSLNNTFNDNDEIRYIYMKLKAIRDSKSDEKFSEADGRRMGDYIMFFEIMDYLISQKMIAISLVDRIFANKFFIFMHNPCVQVNQLQYTGINQPIIDLYVRWYNFRIKKGLKELYPKYSFKAYDDFFKINDDKTITFNKAKGNICP